MLACWHAHGDYTGIEFRLVLAALLIDLQTSIDAHQETEDLLFRITLLHVQPPYWGSTLVQSAYRKRGASVSHCY